MSKILIEKENIFLNLESTTKEEAIKLAGNKLIEAGYVAEGYIESMLLREHLATTYMDYGIAIPHGDRESEQLIIQSGICFLQFKNGIDFGHGNIANVLIASAGKGNNHLRILAGISKVVRENGAVEKLKTSNNINEIYTEIKRYIK